MSAHHQSLSAAPPSAKPEDRASRSRKEWRRVLGLLPYLWEYKVRVVVALVFLVAAKLANVSVPLILKHVVDALDQKSAMVVLPLAMLAADTNGMPPSSAPAKRVVPAGTRAANSAPSSRKISGRVLNRYLSR